MQNYRVELQAIPSMSFRCVKAANSCDLDLNKKLKHDLSIDIDLSGDWNIGLIVGASGSGKTTLAHHIFGSDCFESKIDKSKSVIDLFDSNKTYEDCAHALTSMGLSAVSCWVRPLHTLSNGQQARAQAALAMHEDKDIVIIDEWTSVVDRTVAKAMSVSCSKSARRNNKKIILLACHYDIIDWLEPDWIIDCNEQKFKRYEKKNEKNSYLKSEKPQDQVGECLASIII